jgi:hypothetical protein
MESQVLSDEELDSEELTSDGNGLVPLDTTFAITRAAMHLDETMQMARDLKDPEAALGVVNAWLTIAALLDQDDDEELPRRKHKTGFHHGPHED